MKRFYVPMMFLLLMAGCQKSEQENAAKDSEICEFSSTMELFDGTTKTSMTPDRQVVWSVGDQVAIFQGSTAASKYQVYDECAGTSNGRFKIIANAAVGDDFSSGMQIPTNIALYPYIEGMQCSLTVFDEETSDSYTISGLTFPDTQQYSESSFPEESFMMVAVTNSIADHTLNFRNVNGALKLQLCGKCKVKSIKLEGNNDESLAGDVTITAYPGTGLPTIAITGNSSKSITLDCGDGVQLDPAVPVDFIMSVPPTNFKEGFTVTVTDTDGTEMPVRATVANEIRRSSLLKMPVINIQSQQNPDEPSTDEESSIILTDHISATYAEFVTTLDKNCQAMFYSVISEAEAQVLMATTDDKKSNYIYKLAQEGFGIVNKNFSFDEQKGIATGSSYSSTEFELYLSPSSQYRVVFICRDYYRKLSGLKFSDMFTTKTLVKDNPSANKSAINLKFSEENVSSVKFEFTYDPENTSVFHFAFIPDDLVGNADRDYMLNSVLLNNGGQIIANTWWRNASGYDSYRMEGLDFSTQYNIAYVAEDMDGILSEVLYSSFITLSPQVGPNPEVEITPKWNDEENSWEINLKIVQDVERFYFSYHNSDDLVGNLTELGSNKYSGEYFRNMWEYASHDGFIRFESTIEFVYDCNPAVLLVFAIGRNDSGEECYFFDYVILTSDGQVKKLKDYYPDYED